ncbi:MAG: hypothetical protein JOY70_08245, partial [Acidisphaera sp.]|nr:hypothetical protein [Acidisphaera sp.]
MTASVPALAPASQPAAAGSDAKQHAMLLALAAALIALRLPDAVLDGRFWAEEGAVYFRNALHDGWAAALFTVHTGYLNLAASTATLLAAHVPLPCAPYVTETVALLLQLCPAALLLTADLPWLRRPVTGLIAVALIVLAPNAAEVWLNSITSQFHLALAAALVLALPVRRGVAGAAVLLLLAFAGLSGPAAAALAPLSALRAALDRSPGRAWQAAVLLLCAAVQAAVWLAYPEPARSLGIDPQTLLLAAAVKHLALPLLGLDAARATGVWLASHPLSLPAGAACAATLAAAAALAAGVVRAGRAELAWMFAAGLALACF